MAALGMNAAISVRVSNELGAAHPRTAKFSLIVAVISSFMVGLVLLAILLATQDIYPSLFSRDLRTYKPGGCGKGCGSNSTAPPCTGLIEMMAPVFSSVAWRCVWYMIQVCHFIASSVCLFLRHQSVCLYIGAMSIRRDLYVR